MMSLKYVVLVYFLADFSSSLVIYNSVSTKMLQIYFRSKLVNPENSKLVYKGQKNNKLWPPHCRDGILEQQYVINGQLNRCPPSLDNTFPNPSNCRTFYNCCGCNCSEMVCSDHLLYNNKTKECDWPEEANCCEFWEKDPGKLVSDGVFM